MIPSLVTRDSACGPKFGYTEVWLQETLLVVPSLVTRDSACGSEFGYKRLNLWYQVWFQGIQLVVPSLVTRDSACHKFLRAETLLNKLTGFQKILTLQVASLELFT